MLGEAVRKRRKALGISQERLAELVDVHRNYIGLVERGEQNLTIDSLLRIAKSLKCKMQDIIVDAGI